MDRKIILNTAKIPTECGSTGLHKKDLHKLINNVLLTYVLFGGHIQLQMVSFFASRGQLHDALLVAQVACEGGLSLPQRKEKKPLDLKKNDILPSLKDYMTDENKG